MEKEENYFDESNANHVFEELELLISALSDEISFGDAGNKNFKVQLNVSKNFPKNFDEFDKLYQLKEKISKSIEDTHLKDSKPSKIFNG